MSSIIDGVTISGLPEITSLGGSEDFVVRLASSNFKLPYSKLLTRMSTDLGVSHPLTTNGDIMIFSAVPTRLAIGTQGDFLTVSPSGLPEWSTQTFLADPTTTNGDIIFKNAGLLDRRAIGAEGQVLTVSSGIPVWAGSLYTSPLTTNEDLLVYRGGVHSRVPIGSEGSVLKVSSGVVSWSTPSTSILSSNGSLLSYNSGEYELGVGTEGQFLQVTSGLPVWSTQVIYSDPLTTEGDIAYRTGGVTDRLAIGTDGRVLSPAAGSPTWVDITTLISIEDLIPFNATVTGATSLEDGFAITWDDTAGEFNLTPTTTGSLVFENGINLNSNIIGLGGLLTGNTDIDGDNIYAISVSNALNVNIASDGSSVYNSSVNLSTTGSKLTHQNSIGGAKFEINVGENDLITILDEVNSAGMAYADDYSANFTNESIPSVRWVNDEFQSKLPLSPTASSPGAGQDDYILYWDDTAGVYEMKVESGVGAVTKTGTPVNNQLAIWTTVTELEGDANLTWEAAGLDLHNKRLLNLATPTVSTDGVTKGYVDSKIASKNININVSTPGAGQNGHALSWDNGASEYVLSAAAGGSVALGAAQYQIPFTNGALTDLSYLANFTYNSNTQLTVDNGTNLLPSYSFASDLNTGMYRVAADQLGFTAGGINIFTIGTSGVNLPTGSIQIGGTTVIDATRQISNVTRLDVDNIRIDLNTISNTSANLPLILAANGTGTINLNHDINAQSNSIKSVSSLFVDEKASADADVAGDGQVWVKNSTPNELFFTDDTGVDVPISKSIGWRFGRNNTPITLTTAATYYVLNRSASDANHHVSGVTDGTGSVTILVSGLYSIGVSGSFAGKNDNDIVSARVVASGAKVGTILQIDHLLETSNSSDVSTNTIVYLPSGTVLTPSFSNLTSSTDSVLGQTGQTFFCGAFLGT